MEDGTPAAPHSKKSILRRSYCMPNKCQRFTGAMRLKRPQEFQAVYNVRQRASDQVLQVCARPNELGHARLGLSVARRVGCAAVRNRWKRCIREAFRRSLDSLPKSLDLVVIPRPGAKPGLDDIRQSMIKLSWQLDRRFSSTP
jgi:ribonuclease P protein component